MADVEASYQSRSSPAIGHRAAIWAPRRSIAAPSPATPLIYRPFALWQGSCHKDFRYPMLKITLHDSAHEFRLKLEGRLSGLWVRELHQCWQTASSTTHGRKTVLDLGEVDFVDPEGQSLLATMHRQGVELIAVTPLICAVLEEVCQGSACATVGKAGSST